MISILRWDSSARTCHETSPDKLPENAAAVAPEDVWWIDLADPTPEEEEAVFGKFFPIHALTREDITRARAEPQHGTHLPKAEEFPDYLFVVVNPLPPGLEEALKRTQPNPKTTTQEPSPVVILSRRHRPQLSAVMNHRVLITHHYQELACITTARMFVGRHSETVRRGPDFLFHHVLDAMVDEYAPVVERVAARLDGLEMRLFKDPTPKLLGRLLRLKRVVSGLRKTLILEREVLARLIRGEFELVDDREVVYYRNVYDHLVRYTELIESAREMVSDLMETHLSAVSNRLNQVMKVLTTISTIVLPMTLVAGIYGMNFEENVWPGYKTGWGFPFALALMAFLGIGSLLYFRSRRWV
jgi:magnesium transporter